MIISPSLLLARCCCISLLLLVLLATTSTSTSTAITASSSNSTTTRLTSSPSSKPGARTSQQGHISQSGSEDNSSLKEATDKCQFNLTDASKTVVGRSSTYEHLGFWQCEYLISAPEQHIIQLKFTHINSHADMPVVNHNYHHQQQQQATKTKITPVSPPPSSSSPSSLAPTSQSSKLSLLPPSPSQKATRRNLTAVAPTVTLEEYKNNIDADAPTKSSVSSLPDLTHSTRGSSDLGKEVGTSTVGSVSNQEEGEEDRRQSSTNAHETQTSNSFSVGSGDNHEGKSFSTDSDCDIKFIIEGVNITENSRPQVICWHKSSSSSSNPLTYRYSVPVKITYVWATHSRSGFLLDFSFLQSKDVDCQFRCNGQLLCLFEKQICDGNPDCPDHSDERSSRCQQVQQQQDSGDSSTIKVVIVVSVVVVVVVVFIIVMISRSRLQSTTRLSGGALLRPQHSHSSDVCLSTLSSIQDGGQYDQNVALLQDRQHDQLHHPMRPHPSPMSFTVAVPSSHCSEHQRLLQQQQTDCRPVGQHFSIEMPVKEVTVDGNHSTSPSHRHNHRVQQQQQQEQRQQKHFDKQSYSLQNTSEMLPPHIAVSRDGEEGYARAQRALRSKQQQQQNWQVEHEVFRPAPNRTVHDRDSPPPPYSLIPPSTKSLDSLVPPLDMGGGRGVPTCRHMSQTSPMGVPRCHSLSCHHQASIYQKQQQQRSHHLDYQRCLPPPDYHNVAKCPEYTQHCGTSSEHLRGVGLGGDGGIRKNLNVVSVPVNRKCPSGGVRASTGNSVVSRANQCHDRPLGTALARGSESSISTGAIKAVRDEVVTAVSGCPVVRSNESSHWTHTPLSPLTSASSDSFLSSSLAQSPSSYSHALGAPSQTDLPTQAVSGKRSSSWPTPSSQSSSSFPSSSPSSIAPDLHVTSTTSLVTTKCSLVPWDSYTTNTTTHTPQNGFTERKMCPDSAAENSTSSFAGLEDVRHPPVNPLRRPVDGGLPEGTAPVVPRLPQHPSPSWSTHSCAMAGVASNSAHIKNSGKINLTLGDTVVGGGGEPEACSISRGKDNDGVDQNRNPMASGPSHFLTAAPHPSHVVTSRDPGPVNAGNRAAGSAQANSNGNNMGAEGARVGANNNEDNNNCNNNNDNNNNAGDVREGGSDDDVRAGTNIG